MNAATPKLHLELSPVTVPALLAEAANALEPIKAAALAFVRARVAPAGKIDRKLIDVEQHIVHGLAWVTTYVETLREVANWAQALQSNNQFGQTESALSCLLFAHYLGDLKGGIAMNQGETIRPSELGLEDVVADALSGPAAVALLGAGTQELKTQAADLVAQAQGKGTIEATGLDETYEMIRDTFRRFGQEKVAPYAHGWHLADELIPMPVVTEMGDLGVFGLTIPEEYGGSGMGKTAMCVVSEELSRAYIGVGSLGTRSEIAAELILNGGTEAQKQTWLPKIASAEILPTAVFTEPNTGSDLGALRTRGENKGTHWEITGNKTWITHAARADLMTLLARTKPETTNFSGLSMFLATKPRGTDDTPFPAEGMTGGEIEVLGYRGMKEYELGFDGFKVDSDNLLGGVEGMGFKHLMATFESARIQTAARAIGVAQNALDLGLSYALDRQQFGVAIFSFPRVHNKLVQMAAEILGARQLTYFAARQKDEDKRCDLEAGMAKLLAARVAWAAADNALQIHGGNGFALEYPVSRVLQDARILNIFEGAGEIQAQVIARRLLED
ncbi:(2S)-methylsuccinyl-CoA dehydrogenase [Candidatus Phycosocius bacilliformis]|uniref:(2S)-methylsuccinyl-CoA dehydrogenase n=1 Tax=Candidatus Phycosocius bacilliformis TaxID=1445552 RepID=A0A2P2EED7_9PROT|nr:acyl-CoA dehydrogenase family protein [Candidatus Phycosocius bacilliformis]GBF59421.1 (2S)-methylsuccinyl-CoA dehydrogenase [Candidatus Phycosocius bacilliformis]